MNAGPRYLCGKGAPPYYEAIAVTLSVVADQTVLVVEVRGMLRDAVAFYGAGWQIHAENLACYLDGV